MTSYCESTAVTLTRRWNSSEIAGVVCSFSLGAFRPVKNVMCGKGQKKRGRNEILLKQKWDKRERGQCPDSFDPTASFFLFKIIFCIYFLFVISHSSLSFKSVWLSACISFGAPLLLGTHTETHTHWHTLSQGKKS